MTLSKRIQDHLRMTGKQHYTEAAAALGVSKKEVSSRVHGMASRGMLVFHGEGMISPGDVNCHEAGHQGGGSKGPYRRKVLDLGEDDRYVLRQISFEPRDRKTLLELFGEDEAVHLQRAIGKLLRRLWIFLRQGEYEITNMGKMAIAIIDEEDAKLEAKKAARAEKERDKPAVVPHMRDTKTGRARRSAAPRLDDSLH
jgi:DNA-binding Lrp family transcriptional regulator